jgi:hypothetical protein
LEYVVRLRRVEWPIACSRQWQMKFALPERVRQREPVGKRAELARSMAGSESLAVEFAGWLMREGLSVRLSAGMRNGELSMVLVGRPVGAPVCACQVRRQSPNGGLRAATVVLPLVSCSRLRRY